MTAVLVSPYVAGSSPLHRARPGVKVFGLAILTTMLVAFPKPLVLASAAVLVVVGYLLARVPVREFAAQIWALRWFVVLLGVAQWWAGGLTAVLTGVVPLLIAVPAAALVTATTRVSAMVDLLAWALTPLRRFGVQPERFSLVVALVLRAVPTLFRTFERAVEARSARGASGNHPRVLVSVIAGAILHADRTGEALAARGWDDAISNEN